MVWTVYAPSLLLMLGQGMALASVPLYAAELGANFALIGIAVGANHVGRLIFNVPAGLLVSHFGQRQTMIVGTIGISVLSIASGAIATLPMFIILRFGMGAFNAIWSISRQTYIADVVPVEQRGRALSLVGGTVRLATIIGPVSGGFIALAFGLPAAFYAQGAIAMITAALVVIVINQPRDRLFTADAKPAAKRLAGTLAEHKHDLSTAGAGAIALQLVRNTRQTLIPLWGSMIGLDVASIGSIMSISAILDFALFLPAGLVMDWLGRKWVLIPSLVITSAALMLIPVTHSFGTLMAISILAGLGNGIGSGIVLTIGVDLAPRDRPGEFIGIWRLVTDTGSASGPFILGWVAQITTLGIASVAVGGIGYLGIIGAILMRETLSRGGRK